MTDIHRHEWTFITDGPDCDECIYSAVIAIAKCECGEMMGPSQMERKLSAVEYLSAIDARFAEGWLSSATVFGLADKMKDYAKVLEGEDAQA